MMCDQSNQLRAELAQQKLAQQKWADRLILKPLEIEQSTNGWSLKMLDAISAACRLPDGEIRNNLLRGLTNLLALMSYPPMMFKDSAND